MSDSSENPLKQRLLPPDFSTAATGEESSVNHQLDALLDPDSTQADGMVNSEAESYEAELERKIRRVQRELFCFHCNRPESHVPGNAHRWFGSFLLGLSLGLTTWIGPFYCRCCGQRRLMWWNWANVRYWIVQWQNRDTQASGKRRSSRSGSSRRGSSRGTGPQK